MEIPENRKQGPHGAFMKNPMHEKGHTWGLLPSVGSPGPPPPYPPELFADGERPLANHASGPLRAWSSIFGHIYVYKHRMGGLKNNKDDIS